MAGFATLHWRRHWHDFRLEAEFLVRAWRRRGLAEQLRARRRSITADIDSIADEWELETRRRIPERPAGGVSN